MRNLCLNQLDIENAMTREKGRKLLKYAISIPHGHCPWKVNIRKLGTEVEEG